MSNSYEFTPEQNSELDKLVSTLRGFAMLIYLCGAVCFCILFVQLVLVFQYSALAVPVFWILAIAVGISMWLMASVFHSAGEWKKVIDTEGNDVHHMMAGLQGFTKIFHRGAVALWIFLAITVGLLVFGFAAGGSLE